MNSENNEELNKQETAVSWAIAARVWWWVTWRSTLLGFFGGFAIGLILAILFTIIGVIDEIPTLVYAAIGGSFGIFIKIYFTKKLIGHKFKEFTLELKKN